MVSTDIGNICSTANSYLRFDQPASFFGAMSFGNCGYAFPAAMVNVSLHHEALHAKYKGSRLPNTDKLHLT